MLIAGGVLISDELQYNAANLAPTARYEELAEVGTRFAGRGPALFTDFDEYSLYELRDLDVGSPNFLYPSPSLASAAGGYGKPFALDSIPPATLAAYPLIVTRRNPAEPRPPAAYRLAWQDGIYQVWQRRPGARPALRHVALAGSPRARCQTIARLAATAGRGDLLTGSLAPRLVGVALGRSAHPGGWARLHGGLVMSSPGTMRAGLRTYRARRWKLWLQGDFMPTVRVSLDGHPLGALSGQLSGNSLITGTVPPFAVTLSAGEHTLTVTRGSPSLAPGARGTVVLHAAFLTPAEAPAAGQLVTVPAGRAGALCARPLQWVELRRG